MNVTKTFTQFCDQHDLSIPTITKESLRGTKIGKILRRELIKACPCYKEKNMEPSLNYVVQTGTCCWNAALHVERLRISDRYEDFVLAYNNETIHSCMTGEAEKFAEFYISNNIKIAYLMLDGKVTARTLVRGGLFSDVYGTQIEELAIALRELGYSSSEESKDHFLPESLVLPRHADGEFYLPYIDALGGKLFVKEWETDSNIGLRYLNVFNPFNSDIEDNDWEVEQLEEWEQTLQQFDPNQVIVLPNKEQQIISHETFQQVQYTVLPIRQNPVSTYQVQYEMVISRKYEELNEEEETPRWQWNLLRISGRPFWLRYGPDGYCERYFMDDYGNTKNARFDPPYYVREEIELDELGQF
jgi:hypothetical protein